MLDHTEYSLYDSALCMHVLLTPWHTYTISIDVG